MKPTEEQAEIIEAFDTGNDLVIESLAGTGKTTTLKLIGNDKFDKNGLYIAYNKAIQMDAASSFPKNVTCVTAHSLAFRSVGRKYAHKLNAERMPSKQVAEIMGIRSPYKLENSNDLSEAHLARMVMDTIRRFANSNDDSIERYHVPYQDGVEEVDMSNLRDIVHPVAIKAWGDITSYKGGLRFEHDHYLKMWAMDKPRLEYDFIMLDEAQDANPVIAGVFEGQDCQKIMVGDRCQPAGTMVVRVLGRSETQGQGTITEIVPIEEIMKGDTVVSYNIPSAYLRRTGSRVIGVTERDHFGHIVEITTESGLHSSYTDNHFCLVRMKNWLDSMTIRAENLCDGMEVLPMIGAMDSNGKRVSENKWESITVNKHLFTGKVYSLEVENDHTYIADGIITHNCQAIYGWRGALDAMKNFSGQRLYLSQSFRFGEAIAEEANKFLRLLESPIMVKGLPSINSSIGLLESPDAVLCRTNAEGVRQVMSYQANETPVAMVGGGEDIKSFAFAALDLMKGRKPNYAPLAAFSDWAEVLDYVENDSGGSDLKVNVRLMRDFGPVQVIDAMKNLSSEKDAKVVVSTAHRAKGREWDSVRIGVDFQGQVKDGDESPPVSTELMLDYVAVTRAKNVLDRGGLMWVDNYI